MKEEIIKLNKKIDILTENFSCFEDGYYDDLEDVYTHTDEATKEFNDIRKEFSDIKTELTEIKKLLLKNTK